MTPPPSPPSQLLPLNLSSVSSELKRRRTQQTSLSNDMDEYEQKRLCMNFMQSDSNPNPFPIPRTTVHPNPNCSNRGASRPFGLNLLEEENVERRPIDVVNRTNVLTRRIWAAIHRSKFAGDIYFKHLMRNPIDRKETREDELLTQLRALREETLLVGIDMANG